MGRLHPKRVLLQACSTLKARENFIILVYEIGCKVKEMAAKAKYMRGYQILVELTMQNT